jgi:hypothetical protein
MAAFGLIRLIGLAGAFALVAAPAGAQVRTIDPNNANADLAPVPSSDAGYGAPTPAPSPPAPADTMPPPAPGVSADPALAAPPAAASTTAGSTYHREDVISAAEGVFGKGAEGLAKMIESILKDQGEPNAYVAGREAGGAIGVGLRYGSGTLFHKIEGNQPIYWTGPSLGFDLGASGSKTFMLIYNLYDSNEIYKRFPGGEGVIYLVGGFNASYQRRGDIVVIPIRLGVGWRLGANVGYLKFSKESRILPF